MERMEEGIIWEIKEEEGISIERTVDKDRGTGNKGRENRK